MEIWKTVDMDSEKNHKTTIILTQKEKLDLKIMCALTNKRMTDFIRIAIRDKIKQVKERNNGNVQETH